MLIIGGEPIGLVGTKLGEQLDFCLRFIHSTFKPHIYYMILTTHTNDTHIM